MMNFEQIRILDEQLYGVRKLVESEKESKKPPPVITEPTKLTVKMNDLNDPNRAKYIQMIKNRKKYKRHQP